MIFKKFILPILIIPLFFAGCASQEEIKCFLPKTTVSSNSPVITGQSIVLNTPFDEGLIYHWSGPNGFQSDNANPIISNVTSGMAGEYKVFASKGICKTEEISTTVSVITNTVTCAQSNNTASFDSNNYTFIDYDNDAGSLINNEYLIKGANYNNSVHVIFAGDESPKAGIYSIVNKSTALSSGTVHVQAIFYSTSNYFAKSGDVLVYYDVEGNTVAKFCKVPFSYNNNTTTDLTGSTMFTVTK
ncbi:hypothetical protein [Flavobacterium sp. N3904]|uniref:hypothetical protein n=1 Tax=Flavobacterium sp. N3904 TaxID=2986835 RepID=UPI0022258CC1|nr:hypothetical protein [Flavobacterium sp. N3904]